MQSAPRGPGVASSSGGHRRTRTGEIWVAEIDGAVDRVRLERAAHRRRRRRAGRRQLYAIYVLAEHYGSGAGQALLDAAIGGAAASLWILEDNPRARAFYVRNGVRAGRRRQGRRPAGASRCARCGWCGPSSRRCRAPTVRTRRRDRPLPCAEAADRVRPRLLGERLHRRHARREPRRHDRGDEGQHGGGDDDRDHRPAAAPPATRKFPSPGRRGSSESTRAATAHPPSRTRRRARAP